ncbi:MAG: zinc ABC transporter substrate-binding protein [Bacilli bacterium]|jgi:zinc transport system substrate-binding protein|nr:zinc ABC transporter substrate-binding protein [Bacilli bacterium]MDD4057246.1 zinc ABC transporter substrate-binding protein [Bacilli bacterium]MDY0209468.1 zinc ABC transporter substrate-binding protein [Bacilli bacterium]
MKKTLFFFILIGLVFVIAGCKSSDEADIYTTVYPIEFVAKEIVKDKKTVKSVYPRGGEVHDYEPYPKQIIAIADCDILFYIGLGLEPFIENALTTTFRDLKTVKVTDGLQLVEMDGTHTHSKEEESDIDTHIYDTHVWLDPLSLVGITNTVLQELIVVYPEYSEEFSNNAEALILELEALHNEYVEALADEMITSKTIMVDHDAYAYWTFRYGINRIKLRSDNESNEVDPATLIAKINQAKELGIKYIIASKNETKSALFDQYLTNLNAEEEELHHLGTITTNELKVGKNYLSIMRDNLQVLIKVLPRL